MKKSESSLREKNIKVIGLPKNVHGTRLCQRILCKKCGQIDYVSLRVSKKGAAFCRKCAEKILLTYDHGSQAKELLVNRTCDVCSREFTLPEHIALKKPNASCNDCFKGFFVWQGKPSSSGNRSVITKLGSHKIRKFIDDAI
jgi:hypothetical protein